LTFLKIFPFLVIFFAKEEKEVEIKVIQNLLISILRLNYFHSFKVKRRKNSASKV